MYTMATSIEYTMETTRARGDGIEGAALCGPMPAQLHPRRLNTGACEGTSYSTGVSKPLEGTFSVPILTHNLTHPLQTSQNQKAERPRPYWPFGYDPGENRTHDLLIKSSFRPISGEFA